MDTALTGTIRMTHIDLLRLWKKTFRQKLSNNMKVMPAHNTILYVEIKI